MSVPVRVGRHGRLMSDRAPTTPDHRRFLHEWEWLRRRPELVARAERWQIVDPPLTDLEQLVRSVHRAVAPVTRNERLRRLLAIGAHDELAGRVLLRSFLPELDRLHRKRRRQGWPHAEFGDLLATGWIVIRTYNPDRRPADVSNSLLSDIDWREYRSALRRRSDQRCTVPVEFDRYVANTDTTSIEELVDVLSAAHAAGLPDDDLDLLRRIASGHPTTAVAESLGITTRTVRNRRARLAARLRDVAVAA